MQWPSQNKSNIQDEALRENSYIYISICIYIYIYIYIWKERDRDRQIDRYIDRQTDIDRQSNQDEKNYIFK